MIARVIYDKGVLEYVEAARYLQTKGIKAVCQLLGKIETDAGLGASEETVKSWEGLVQYLPPTDDVRPYIAQADCVVLPSYREGTPRTLLEAMGMAKPLVATNVPGCKETVIEGYNGFLCEVKNGLSLGQALEKMLLLPPAERERMAQNSRRFAEERFDEKLVINAYLEALNALQ
jgi:glycosyltransferase involved in cell wall biosynthesis